MPNMSVTAMRNELTKRSVEELEEIFRNADIEFYRTGANFNTLTYLVGEINGKEVYGSIKFTLHKENYNLDDEIEEYELLLEDRSKKAQEKELRDRKALKEQEDKARKAAEKKDIAARAKEKRLRTLEERKANIEALTSEDPLATEE